MNPEERREYCRAYNAQYRRANPQKFVAYATQWNAEHAESVKAYKKAWYRFRREAERLRSIEV
jgi:hypothetical protein